MPSTTDAFLLDANVLIALSVVITSTTSARTWVGRDRRFASCPSTQGSLVRFLVRVASVEHAEDVLGVLAGHPRREFLPDRHPYDPDVLVGVHGYRQVTDAYLAHVARANETRLATFDSGLKNLRPDVGHLVP